MSRSLFALLPLLLAFLTGSALAGEPAAVKEETAPLWQQVTKDPVAAEPKPEAKPEAKEVLKEEPKAEAEAKAANKEAAQETGKEVGKAVEFGTQEQYGACMDSESRIKDLRKMLEEHIALNNEAMMEIKNQANSLLEMQRKLVMSDDAQVQAFNKRTEAHNKLVKSANESSDKLKAELEAFNMKSMEHNQSCASLIVKMSDRDAAIKERTPAMNQ